MATWDGNQTTTMWGNHGEADVFKFAQNHVANSFRGFNPSEDTLDLTGFGHQITWDELSESISISHWTYQPDEAPGRNLSTVAVDLSQWGGGTVTMEWIDGHISLTDLKGAIKFLTPLDGTDANDSLVGSGSVDIISGLDGDDSIDGGAGADRITGGAGDDRLTGGAGDDTFVFAGGHGDDSITDWTKGANTIDLSALGVTAYTDLELEQAGDDVVIDLSDHGGGFITLVRTELDDISADSFIFADAVDGV